jgi:hypothetical protein
MIKMKDGKKALNCKCRNCGKPLSRRIKKSKPQKYFICSECKSNKRNPLLAGGCFDTEGYIRLSVDGKRIFAHRAVMEKHLNRKLKDNELVHHLNGVRTDNRIENLVIVDIKSHPRKSYIHILQERIRQLEGIK